jgi:hypothetical protein
MFGIPKKQTQSIWLWMASFVVNINLFTNARRLAKSFILSLHCKMSCLNKFVGVQNVKKK